MNGMGTPKVLIDTNVFLDIYSCSDLKRVVDERELDSMDVRYRIERARNALLLALHFHNTCTRSYQLGFESLRKIAEYVPPTNRESEVLKKYSYFLPEPSGETSEMPQIVDSRPSFEQRFVEVFVNLVVEKVLFGWERHDIEGVETANEADDRLVLHAKEKSMTLISSEGLRRDGSIDTTNRLRKKAAKAGIQLCSPGEYLRGKISERGIALGFLAGFKQVALQSIGERDISNRVGRAEDLSRIFNLYQWVLLGSIETPLLDSAP